MVKAHGLKGAIKLELYTDSPNERFAPGQVLELQVPETSDWFGKTVKVSEMKMYNQSPVVFLEGITSRELAETLVKAILLVESDPEVLPPEPDAWYDHQLVGLDVMLGDDKVGVISRVDHLPSQDLLAVETPKGEVLIPFVKAIVPLVDVENKKVMVTPPGGLFEVNAETKSESENED